VPEICRFYGIVIFMYQNDHEPGHFHARYAGRTAVFSVGPVEMIRGSIAARAERLVIEWATTHERDLQINWRLARDLKELNKIAPLE